VCEGLIVSGQTSSCTKEDHQFGTVLIYHIQVHNSKSVFRLGWRDLADIIVDWRQISEPNDAVWWVDQLDEHTFTQGYGSQTPIIHGQCNVIRYYPYFKMAFPILRELVGDQSKSNRLQSAEVKEAGTCDDLYCIIGHDFSVTTSCHSHAVPGRVMEGTRLAVHKELPHGFHFMIRTASTPSRWKQYDEEMSHAFDNICQAAMREEKDSHTLLELVLTYAFYWYNFMPLSRGTAACGLVAITGLLLAFGLEITNPIPKGLQVDWEAILRPSHEDFISQMTSQWIRKSVKPVIPDVIEPLPSLEKTFPTLRSVIEVLNYQL
jgi:hypothetical protein